MREYQFFVYEKESTSFPHLFLVVNFYVFLFPHTLDTIDKELVIKGVKLDVTGVTGIIIKMCRWYISCLREIVNNVVRHLIIGMYSIIICIFIFVACVFLSVRFLNKSQVSP